MPALIRPRTLSAPIIHHIRAPCILSTSAMITVRFPIPPTNGIGITIRPVAGAPVARRIGAIDALRGTAVCLMFVYHFAFDLRFYGVVAADFEHDPLWLGLRGFIVASFMLLVAFAS